MLLAVPVCRCPPQHVVLENNGMKKMLKVRNVHNIRIATINVRTLQGDIKLALVVKVAIDLEIYILAKRYVEHPQDSMCFSDDSLKGWQWVWSGLKRKKWIWSGNNTHGSYKEHHLNARIISATLCVKNLRLSVINVYAPKDATESESTKNSVYTALNKEKVELYQKYNAGWLQSLCLFQKQR